MKSVFLRLFGLAPEQREEQALFKQSIEQHKIANEALDQLLSNIKNADQYFERKKEVFDEAGRDRPGSVEIFLEPKDSTDGIPQQRRSHPSYG
jgi:hypothetical protein